MILHLPHSLRDQIATQARQAWPGECCGLLEGRGAIVTALHPARNLAAAVDRFLLDPADHFRAVKAARGRGNTIIGCYHSHPGGAAQPSTHDLAAAAETDFIWLIAALASADAPADIRTFAYSGDGFVEIGLATGADLVTSSL